MARELLRQELGAWVDVDGLGEAVAVDDAILQQRHGFGIPRKVLDQAHARVVDTLRPSPEDVVIQALVKCHLKTVSAKIEGADAELMIEAYTEELREFPADVVDGVLRDWAKTMKWFPALAEIYPELQRRVAYRVRAKSWVEAEMAYASSE